jgi:hypothetical protein
MAIKPSRTTVFAWTENSQVVGYDTSTFSQVFSWTPPTPPSTTNTLSGINFSADSELVILETDAFNPLLVVNLTTNLTLHSIIINETILYAHFLNSSNQQLVVHCQNSLILVDLATMSQYQVSPPLTANIFVADELSNVFTCQNGASSLLEQRTIVFTKITTSNTSTNTSANTSINNSVSG